MNRLLGRTRPVFLTVLTIFAPAAASAQTLASPDPVLEQIWDRAMNQSQVETLAQALLDSIGPRLTGSPGLDRAHAWLIEKYAEWGIAARNEQYGTWIGWRRGTSHIDIMEPRVRSLDGMNLAWSPGTGGPVTAGVVALPDVADPAAFQAWLPTVRGAFVMVSFPEPTCRTADNLQRFATPETLAALNQRRAQEVQAWNRRIAASGTTAANLPLLLEEAGAAGIVTTNWTQGWGTNRIFNGRTGQIPTFELSCEDYGLVFRLAERGQGPVLRVDLDAEFLGEVPVFNTIAEIPGTEIPDEYVMLSAHFDSWDGASGATDNGTGTVVMMEAMRILREVLPNPKRMILVGHWGGEEQGLNGSRAWAQDNPHVVENLQALFNQDSGTGRVVHISMGGLTDAAGAMARWLAALPTEVTWHIRLEVPGMPATGGTDHASFICAGAPAFNLSSLDWEYSMYTWHTNRDTFDKVILDEVRSNVVLAASLAYLASEADERVPRGRRSNMPINPQTEDPVPWPACQAPARSAEESSRL